MALYEKLIGRCELRGDDVEIIMINVKKAKQKESVLTPFRCQKAGDCPKNSFCRFVNPLTTRLPVTFTPPDKAAAS